MAFQPRTMSQFKHAQSFKHCNGTAYLFDSKGKLGSILDQANVPIVLNPFFTKF